MILRTACAMPSTRPTMLPLAFNTRVRKIGRIGVSISVARSAQKLPAVTRKVLLENPPACWLIRVLTALSTHNLRIRFLGGGLGESLDREQCAAPGVWVL